MASFNNWMNVRFLGRADKAKQPSRAESCPCTCCSLTLRESYDPLFSHNQCFILNLQGNQVLVFWISYHLTWCKAYSYLQKMSFDVVPFFSCVADVGGGSSFRSHTDVVIVYCAQSAAGGSFAGLKKEQPVYVLLHEVQLWELFFFFFFFCLTGCGTGFSVTEFCFRVCGIFSLEAPDDVPSSAIAFLPVINLKWHKLCICSILYDKRNTLKQNVTFINQGCRFHS